MDTIIVTELAVDPAVEMDAEWRFSTEERRYIDDQIRGVEQLIVDALINGRHGTWLTLSGASAAVVAGDVVCLGSNSAGVVTKAVSAALAVANMPIGVVMYSAPPGGNIFVIIGGLVSPSITGLAAGAPGFARVNTTTARVERVTSLTTADYGVGVVDNSGWLQVSIAPAPALPAFGTGVSTWLTTPSSANLLAAVTDETGTGAVVFNTAPAFTTSLRLNATLGSAGYVFTPSAVVASHNLILPLMTFDDTMVLQAFTQTLTNKTIVAASNTITDTSAALGDLFRWNGTRFARFARGSANQVLTTNSGATDIVWAAAGGLGTNVTSGSGFISIGTTPAVSGALRLGGSGSVVQLMWDSDTLGTDRALITTDTGASTVAFGAASACFTTLQGATVALSGSSGCAAFDGRSGITNDLTCVEKSLTSNFTVTSTTLAASNLGFPIAASESWDVEFSGLMSSGGAATGMVFSIEAPASTTVNGFADGCSTSISARTGAGITAIHTATAVAFCTIASTTLFFSVKVTVTASVTAGTVSLGLATASGSTGMSILAGAKMTARRTNKV